MDKGAGKIGQVRGKSRDESGERCGDKGRCDHEVEVVQPVEVA